MSLYEYAQVERFKALNRWLSTYQGQSVAQALTGELVKVFNFVHGRQLVCLGFEQDYLAVNRAHFDYYWHVLPYSHHNARLTSALDALPFADNSIDCLVAPLTLNTLPQTNNLINTMVRVVKPLGHLIIININPLSLWGYWSYFSKHNYLAGARINLCSTLWIKRYFFSQGFSQCYFKNFYYIPPISHAKSIQRLALLNNVGKLISPMPAGFCCLVLQKYVTKMVLTKQEYQYYHGLRASSLGQC